MEFVGLDEDNLEEHHICCAISDKKCAKGYQAKKDWLKKRFAQGYVFEKLDVRGKVFIEYEPVENSWLALNGSNFMVINCLWVSGRFKGQGYGRKLLDQCIGDAKRAGMSGIVAVSGEKKRPFMSDPKFFKHHGFEIVDQAPPFFRLWGLRFEETAVFPQILQSARQGKCPDNGGIVAYYSNACPFTDFYTGHLLPEYARQREVPVDIHHITSREEGRAMPIPWVINSVFYRGELVTLEMKAQRHLDKLIA